MTPSAITASFAVLLVLTCTANARDKRPFQDKAHFKTAIVHEEDMGGGNIITLTTGSNFVLLTIVDDRTGYTWTGCMTAQSLEGAVRVENHLSYDAASEERGREIILGNKDHVFHFSESKAFRYIAMDSYDANDMKRARRFVRFHGVDSLEEGKSRQRIGGDIALLNQTALACAVIEAGYSAYMPDRIPYIYAER